MRDLARIDSLLAAIRTYWLAAPDMRLGQIIVNAVGTYFPEIYNVEDDKLLQGIKHMTANARVFTKLARAEELLRELREMSDGDDGYVLTKTQRARIDEVLEGLYVPQGRK